MSGFVWGAAGVCLKQPLKEYSVGALSPSMLPSHTACPSTLDGASVPTQSGPRLAIISI